ncbi:MAG: T9SS type A sorting domain-containing protein [Bacteroidales bacterium]|jgi:hypothetical protein|nr:T9SS type A sorting domain-containing protein [Bacteroidales bacterium]
MKKNLLSLVIALFSTGLFAQSIPFDDYGNVLLENYSELSDDAVIKVIITVTSEESRVGWGIGEILPVGNYSAAHAYDFTCKASSAEGEANEYEFTVAQFKEFAKIDGEYWIDTSGGNNRRGIVINCYNNAVLTSITAGEAVEPSAVIDFEADQIDDSYPGIAWVDTNFTATVKENPAGEGKSLHFVSTNWNSYPKFAVSLPNELKLGDIEKITFNLYFTDSGSSDQNSWKNFHLFVGETGASFTPNAPTQEFNNIVGSDSRNVWITKELVLNITDEALLELNTFDLGLGELVENADYYLDNISFIPKGVASSPGKLINVSNIRVYPSPTKGIVNIENNKGEVFVYSVTGRLIMRTFGNTVDLSKQPDGSYILKAGNNAVKVIKK